MAAQQAQAAQLAAQHAAQNQGRPALEGGTSQPSPMMAPQPQAGSGPSFSLAEGGESEEEGDEVETT
jgi:hypothetical protein